MKKIPLTKGKFALVDDADYKRLSKYQWRINGDGYAGRLGGGRSKNYHVRMHREIMGLPPGPPNGVYVDHINRDRLDNRRVNLRFATKSEDVANRGLSKANTTGFKGICAMPWGGWKAEICREGKWFYLGSFNTPQDAARAYDIKAVTLYGEFALTNARLGLL